MTPLKVAAVAVAIGIVCFGFIWALCRAAARGDREMAAAWERRKSNQEMEHEKWWGVG